MTGSASNATPPEDRRGPSRGRGEKRGASSTPGLAPETVARVQEDLLAWYAANGRDLPWRHTTDPYAVLVSEVMLQQTQVSRVVPRFATFLARFPTLRSLAVAPLADVLEEWMGLGYNNRAVRLRACAAAAGNALPGDLDALQALPGVGPYTARAVLAFAHNADLAAVDANVRRVLTHEFDLPHDLSPSSLQHVADEVLPQGRSRDWHNALMDYGSLVLTSRATGIAPLSRQGPFAGSRRDYRARSLRALLSGGPASLERLAGTIGLDDRTTLEIVAGLERDGLVVTDNDAIRLA